MHEQTNDREEYDSFTLPTTSSASSEDVEDDPTAIGTVDADGKRQLVGYCIVWGAVSSVRRDGFRHRFAKGSITWANPTYALWNHDTGTPLASTANGTLTIAEDDHGAKVTIDLDQTTDADNAFERVKDRLVSGMSFGGNRLAYDKSNDPKIIDITSFIANDVSPTIIPAMTETNIVTAKNEPTLLDAQKNKQGLAATMQKNHFDNQRLALLTTGRVSG